MDEIQKLTESGHAEFFLATVTDADSSGALIQLDGQSTPMSKRFKTMGAVSANTRAVVMKHSGTFIVLGSLAGGSSGLYYTDTFSDFGTVVNMSVSEAYLVMDGSVASLYVKGSWTVSQSSSSEITAFTLKSGFRPKITSLARAWRNVNAILYANGNMRYTGTFSSGDGITFLATYIVG